MKRLIVFGFFAAVMGVAACDGNSPTGAPSEPLTLMEQPVEPIDPWPVDPEPWDTVPTDTTTYPPQPTYEYRITYNLYRSGGDMKAHTQFERGYNGYWTRVDASQISVVCYVNGAFRDGETEYNASLVHITFGTSYQYGKQITCNHSANYGAYTGSTSFIM
jgi:hypothetical protein